MKIVNIKKVGRRKVYDLSVEEVEHYVLKNGVITHNTGVYYSADNIWIIGRRQEKKGTEISGYHFVINIEKSRFVREKSKIPISVSWEGGIEKWSGLLEVALEGGYVQKPKNGWYCGFDPIGKTELTQNMRAVQTMTKEFWNNIFEKTDFEQWIETRYKIATKDIYHNIEKKENNEEE